MIITTPSPIAQSISLIQVTKYNLMFVSYSHSAQILDRCAVWPPGNSPNRPSQVHHLGGERITALFLYAPIFLLLKLLDIFKLIFKYPFSLQNFILGYTTFLHCNATNAPYSLVRSWTVASFPLSFTIVCNPAQKVCICIASELNGMCSVLQISWKYGWFFWTFFSQVLCQS